MFYFSRNNLFSSINYNLSIYTMYKKQINSIWLHFFFIFSQSLSCMWPHAHNGRQIMKSAKVYYFVGPHYFFQIIICIYFCSIQVTFKKSFKKINPLWNLNQNYNKCIANYNMMAGLKRHLYVNLLKIYFWKFCHNC